MDVDAERRTGLARQSLAIVYAILCHGLFVAGVGMMIFQMYSGMSRSFGRLDWPWSLIANAILLSQFPLTHSLLLTRPGQAVLKRLAPRAIGSDLAPTNYVIVAALQTLLLFSLWTPSGVIWWQAEGITHAGLALLYLASWLLLGKAIFDAGIGLQTGAIGWWAVLRNRRPAYPGMPTTGLFRLSRQPIYFAFACTLWTVPTWTPDQLVLALVLTSYCLLGPLHKEARFLRVFGPDFAAYQNRHRYWLPLPRRFTARNDLSIYDRSAAHWWDGSVRWLRTLQNLVPARFAYFDTITDWRGKSVLDLGCGGGFMAEALARRGANVTGLDPAAEAIAIAASHAAASGLTVRYLTGTGEHLPLADHSMDIVVCVDVLEHVTGLDAVLLEIKRVLKPRGFFLFDTINRNWLARLVVVHIAEDLLRLVPKGTHDPLKFIKPEELSAKLTQLGFSVAPPVGLGPRGLDRRLDFIFGRLPTTSIMYMAHAQRDGSRPARAVVI